MRLRQPGQYILCALGADNDVRAEQALRLRKVALGADNDVRVGQTWIIRVVALGADIVARVLHCMQLIVVALGADIVARVLHCVQLIVVALGTDIVATAKHELQESFSRFLISGIEVILSLLIISKLRRPEALLSNSLKSLLSKEFPFRVKFKSIYLNIVAMSSN